MATTNSAPDPLADSGNDELTQRSREIQLEKDPFKRIDAVNSLYNDMGRRYPILVRAQLLSSLLITKKIEYRHGKALLLTNLGWNHLDTDDYEAARNYLLESIELWRDLDNHSGILRTLNGLGACYMDLGLFERAIVHFRDALRQAEKAEQLGHYGIILINLAKCFIDLEQYDQALHCLDQVFESETMDPLNQAIRLHRKATAYRHKGMLKEAEHELMRAIELAADHRSLLVQCACEQAFVYLAQGRPTEAAERAQHCLSTADPSSDRRIITEALLCLGTIAEEGNRLHDAENSYRAALAESLVLGAGVLEVRASRSLSDLFRAQGNFEKALLFAEECRDQERRMARESNNLLALSMEEEQKLREAQLFREQYDQMLAVGELGRLLTGTLQLDQILETIYQKLQGLIPADIFQVGLYDSVHGELCMQLGIEHGLRVPEFRINLSEGGLAAWSFQNSLHVLVNDMADGEMSSMPCTPMIRERESAALIYMPLLRGERTIGIVCVQSQERDVYNKHHVNALSAVASYLAIAMENAALFSRLQIMATEDSLTGFSNRRRLSEVADEEFRRSERYQIPLCVLIMDLDYFKDINDQYGHDAGDLVLRHTGVLIRSMMRDVDSAFRYGGEEFVFLLPNTDLAGGRLLAERIREAQYKLSFSFPSNPLNQVHVSGSIGVAERSPADKDFDGMLLRADKALYMAKHDGRNRVHFLT